MKILSSIILLVLVLFTFSEAKGQDSTKVFLTTAIGVFKPVGDFAGAYGNSLALNSGFEYKIAKNYFAQFVLDFNAVKYSQQTLDSRSSILFQNTNSSVFLAGINVGTNIYFSDAKRIFASPYVGAGYANIGEPRLVPVTGTNRIDQEVVRNRGIFGRGGVRLGFVTTSKLLQTIYLDASYWTANFDVQNSRANAFSFLIGTRIGF